MGYFTVKELLQLRLVCRKWRVSVSEVPVSIRTRKYKLENIENIPFVFNIKSLKFYEDANHPTYGIVLQRCTKLLELIFSYGDSTLIWKVPNLQLLESIKSLCLDNFPFEKLVHLTELV
jgi:hypothetical protein